MIDLRSDTVTRPTEEMRRAMARAPVGDDVYGEDPTVRALEARTAELLGKEDAVYVPTGTLSNQVALRTHAEPGDLALMEAGSHMVLNEGGAAAALAGVTVERLSGEHGVFTASILEEALEPPHPFNPGHISPRPRLVCVENTHNAGGGTVWPLETLRSVAAKAREHGLALHMDGARLWHATAASGVSEAEFSDPFDTVSVCFSKGLGAPVGSALAGSGELIRRARRFKQQYGGGFRQAGIVAAGALHALEHHRPLLGEDIENARLLAKGLAETDGVEVDVDRIQSNIVRFRVTAMASGDFAHRCFEAGVHMLPNGTHGMRAVLHRDVTRDQMSEALETMRAVLDAHPQESEAPAEDSRLEVG